MANQDDSTVARDPLSRVPAAFDPDREGFDAQGIESFAERIGRLRIEILCDYDQEILTLMTCQHVNLAHAALEQAECFLRMAALIQTRAIAERRGA